MLLALKSKFTSAQLKIFKTCAAKQVKIKNDCYVKIETASIFTFYYLLFF